MLALVRAGGLPEPELNARIGRWTVDFLWRREKVIVEIDGYRFHSSRAKLERITTRTSAYATPATTCFASLAARCSATSWPCSSTWLTR